MIICLCVMWGFHNALALKFDVVSISKSGGLGGLGGIGGVWGRLGFLVIAVYV